MTAILRSWWAAALANKGSIALAIGLLCHVLAWSGYAINLTKDQMFLLMAIAYLCYALSALYGASRVVAIVFVGLAASNLADELFFNPYAAGWNEYAGAIITVWWACSEHIRKKGGC